ncbi:unnamed protein product [Ascophyllum nodosum]
MEERPWSMIARSGTSSYISCRRRFFLRAEQIDRTSGGLLTVGSWEVHTRRVLQPVLTDSTTGLLEATHGVRMGIGNGFRPSWWSGVRIVKMLHSSTATAREVSG